MRNGPVLTMVRDYENSPESFMVLTAEELAQKYGCSPHTVRYTKRVYGISYRHLHPGPKPGTFKPVGRKGRGKYG